MCTFVTVIRFPWICFAPLCSSGMLFEFGLNSELTWPVVKLEYEVLNSRIFSGEPIFQHHVSLKIPIARLVK